MQELYGKDFDVAPIKIVKWAIKNMLDKKHQQRQRRHEEKPNGNFRSRNLKAARIKYTL